MPQRFSLALAFGVLVARVAAQADFQGSTHMVPFEQEPFNYGQAVPVDAVARLQAQIDKGETRLAYDPELGYLTSVLQALRMTPSSQMLVFSKTSFQRDRISPHSPRAVYFNDDVYLGFVPGAPLLEISVADPKMGAVFYTLSQETNANPRFVRNDQCLECHASAKTMGVPGHLIRSLATDGEGVADLSTGPSLVNHRTPLAQRWGGWFVTGSSGGQPHRGNLVGKEAFARYEQRPSASDLEELEKFFDVSRYPAPKSDIVALMVLEHQAHLHNFITRLHHEATIMLGRYGHLRYLKSITDSFLKYLLFTEEAPLTASLRGTSGFTEQFTAQGPRDQKGRSLRDFDLRSRLFKYPCSYLIYSEAFEALPKEMKALLYQRLWDILSSQDTSPAFATLREADRQTILEILRDTKPDLPEYWRTAGN